MPTLAELETIVARRLSDVFAHPEKTLGNALRNLPYKDENVRIDALTSTATALYDTHVECWGVDSGKRVVFQTIDGSGRAFTGQG